MFNTATNLVFIVVLVIVILRVVTPRWDVHIVVRDDSVQFRKGIAEVKRTAMENFFRNDLKLQREIQVRGRRDQNGRLSIHVDGELDAGTQQRIRNFLHTMT